MTDPEPALLLELTKARAHIAELEAERDEYWRRFNSSQDANKNLAGMVRDARAERDAMRPVVDAVAPVANWARGWHPASRWASW